MYQDNKKKKKVILERITKSEVHNDLILLIPWLDFVGPILLWFGHKKLCFPDMILQFPQENSLLLFTKQRIFFLKGDLSITASVLKGDPLMTGLTQ